jgi:hypothetical protein
MSEWTSRSGSRRRTGRPAPDDDPGARADPDVDDWQWDGIDWSETELGAERSHPASESPGRPARVGLIPGGEPAAGPDRAQARHLALVRRRRIAALAALGSVFVVALVLALVVFGGGGSALEQTTPLTTVTTPPATTVERPATTTTTPPKSSTASPLRLVLPEGVALRRGDRGSAVVTLQKALAALGFATGRPDGVFGQITAAAVVDFQQSNNLSPDGVVGTDTVRLLNAAIAKKAAGA